MSSQLLVVSMLGQGGTLFQRLDGQGKAAVNQVGLAFAHLGAQPQEGHQDQERGNAEHHEYYGEEC
ncbi:MAG: hypothetical protein C0508_05260 [Cyanobacteria bacterium PR.023]|nr:hypothetical protein [Cyanobacteria bacterium PR.023]